VIDTSTLVGAVIRADSLPHRAWLLAQQSCEILASTETFAEVESVLHRKQLERYVDVSTRDEFLSVFRSIALWVEVSNADLLAVDPPCRDPKDNMFLALAAVGYASALISSDHDLLVLNPWQGIAILTPAQFLAEIGA
jgi:putative PIN family toxin of toxin-antitoxin system